jgi:putative addiction module killer protein
MLEVRETAHFSDWINSLRDLRAAARIDARIGRLRLGNFGDAKSVGDGASELRIDYGPGYRAYLRDAARPSSSCRAAAPKGRKPAILDAQRPSRQS